MKKLICILAGAALFGACEQKTTTVNPPAEKTEKKTENNTTIIKPADSTKKTETETKTTTSTSPNP
jgi:PBP1b-binding outer membrane lipoprotein LpoB